MLRYFGVSVRLRPTSTPRLNPDDESRVVAALVKLDWMEFPFETSCRTVGKLQGCPDDGATAI
jgi:hypothetical protein